MMAGAITVPNIAEQSSVLGRLFRGAREEAMLFARGAVDLRDDPISRTVLITAREACTVLGHNLVTGETVTASYEYLEDLVPAQQSADRLAKIAAPARQVSLIVSAANRAAEAIRAMGAAFYDAFRGDHAGGFLADTVQPEPTVRDGDTVIINGPRITLT